MKISPSTLSGTIRIPPSKSHTHRALLFALLAEGTSLIKNPLDSPDIEAMIRAIELFGATVTKKKGALEVVGRGGKLTLPNTIINAHNSGIILRFMGALAALLPKETTLSGDHSLQTRRVVKPLLTALEELGAFAKSIFGNGRAPILIRGPIQGGKCHLDGEDSQPVSALLIATSFAKGPTDIYVTNAHEKPWIDLTLDWLKFLALPYTINDYTHYHIPGNGHLKGFTYTVPGDFSSLAFPTVGALITQSEITIENVDRTDVQGDKKLFDVLTQMGANLTFKGKNLHIKKGKELIGQTIDVSGMIDALSILAVLGCFAKGETLLKNGKIARKKECDRIHATALELKKMGADIDEREDGLLIRPSKLFGAEVNAHSDHRMGMSLAIAALSAEGITTLEGSESIAKTYPQFKDHLKMLGAKIR